MGFKKVYKALQEVFPEVDIRLLRAVAIEQQKDVNSAVEVVLAEVIPYLTENSCLPHLSSSEGGSQGQSPKGKCTSENACAEDVYLQPTTLPDENQHGQFYDAESEPDQLFHDANGGPHQICGETSLCKLTGNYDERAMTICANASSPVPSVQLIHGNGANADSKVSGSRKSEGRAISDNYEESKFADVSNQQTQITSSALDLENLAVDQSINSSLQVDLINGENYLENNWADGEVVGMENSFHLIAQPSFRMSNLSYAECVTKAGEMPYIHNPYSMDEINNSLRIDSSEGNCRENNCSDGEVVGMESSTYLIPRSSFRTSNLSYAQCVSKSVDMADIGNPETVEEINNSGIGPSKVGSSNELADVIDESTLTTGVTPYAHICSIDLLEDIIADGRNHKKTLFSAVESVIGLMREVELQEQAAERAKEEAAKGAVEIFNRVEELKKMLQHAKEANDMHGGEVYGEKAILATEVRELQSRLLSLSDERDKSLGILDEMRRSLEVRLAAAEKEREAAEKEKLEKEENGRKLLAEQEKIMEKVVQEANMVKQEAEENSKLQEFLVDRGRLVDMLQGEISVICQDVRLLKEKFDERLPLSKSLTSSQTSCILASSSSSLKSMVPEQVDQVTDSSDPSETVEKMDLVASFTEPKSFGAQTATSDQKALIDDGWEICEP